MTLILVTLTFFLSGWLTYRLMHPQTVLYIVNEPNARSLHTHPIPATGGVAILTAFALSTTSVCFYNSSFHFIGWIELSVLLIAVISLLDDHHHVPALYRLVIHFLAAYLFLTPTHFWITQLTLPDFVWVLPSPLNIGVSLLFVVWMVNLYNFMDGMDGFAGGMTIFGFGSFALLGGLAGHAFFMTINLIIVSATAGFLVFNFPPAKIFMGDIGSSSLGFLAAALTLWGSQENIFPLWIALLIFSPFIVDATLTLFRRLFRGEKIWLAHKSHYYQRLVQLGWGHKRTVLWEYTLMAACSGSALIGNVLTSRAQLYLLITWIIIYGVLIHLVTQIEKNNREGH